MPVAMMPNLGSITLLQADGEFTPEEFKEALNLAMKGIREVYAKQREALRRRYLKVREEVEGSV